MAPLTSKVESGTGRSAWISRWAAGRGRARRFFGEILTDRAYYERPIPLRHPFVFYEGHLAAFAVNVLVKQVLGRPGIDPALETLFARGIDPADAAAAPSLSWPTRASVRAYVERADAAVFEALETTPESALAEAAPLVAEHEEMHLETLLYMLHRLPVAAKRRPEGRPGPETDAEPPARRSVRIGAGCATLGAARGEIDFGWDNEFPSNAVFVGEFEIDAHAVTNADWLEFMDAGGYVREDLWTPDDLAWREASGVRNPAFWEERGGAWTWRAQFGNVPLPPAWPVYVSHAEAQAYARWRSRRLPTEAEYHRAAFGRPAGGESPHPWGDASPADAHGNFDFRRWDPLPCGARPAGDSAWGVADLVGNGWEWTATPFEGFPGFHVSPLYPAYSADFFDGRHFVLKGASPGTAAGIVRRSFRNWFQPHYQFVYAKFRTVAP